MKRREALKKVGVSSIALTTALAGCSQNESTSQAETTDKLNPDTPDETNTEPRQKISKEISVAPMQGDKVEHDSWSHEFREVDGEEVFVVSVTTRNPSEAEAGTLEYLYQFGFFHNGDEAEDALEIEKTIPEDGEGIEPGENHEWELMVTENPQELYQYDAHIQPGGV